MHLFLIEKTYILYIIYLKYFNPQHFRTYNRKSTIFVYIIFKLNIYIFNKNVTSYGLKFGFHYRISQI